MKTEYLDKVWDAAHSVDFVSRDLVEMAGAFFTTGNHIVGKQLLDMSGELKTSAKDIRDGLAQNSHAEYTETMEGVGKTLTLLVENALRQ